MQNETKIRDTLASVYGLQGRTAFITGAASGIGKATAKLFAAVGASVVVADLDEEGAKVVVKDIETDGGRAIAVRCDVANEIEVKLAFEVTQEVFGGVDVLVNNAAYRPKAEFLEMSVEQWDTMHAVNTRGTFLCMREAISLMRASGKGGSIVNISSIGTLHPTTFGNTHYDSSKAGMNAITQTSAIEFAADGIRINAVLPGGTLTEGVKKLQAAGSVSKGPYLVSPTRFPMSRLAQPNELAQAILFLASPAASYITGVLLPVDGGFSMS